MSNIMTMHLSLLFSNGPLAGQSFPITKSETRVGSDPQLNDLLLTDPSLMPEHARIISENNRHIIQRRDTQSLLVVNFQPVEYAILHDGDHVMLGQPGVSFTTQMTSAVSPALSAQPILTPPPIQANPFPPLAPTPPLAQPLPGFQFPPAKEVLPSPSLLDPQLSFSGLISPAQVSLMASPQTPLQVPYIEATRYLCVAAHLDEKFHRFVLRTIIGEEHRAIGETYGIDSIPVLKVSYAAQRRVFVRDCILLAFLVVACLFLMISLFSLFGFMHTSPPISSATPLTGMLALFQGTAFVVVAVSLIFFYSLGVLIFLLISKLFSLRIHPATLLLLVFLLFYWSAIPFFFLAWLVVAIEHTFRYYGADAIRLTKKAFNPANLSYPLDPTVEQKAHMVFPPQDGNVVVYSGSSPFAGAGVSIGGWSFPIDTTKGKQEGATTLKPKTFQLNEIYTHVNDALKSLDLAGKSRSTVSFEEKLYVNGQEIRSDMRFLREPFGRPYNQISEQLIEQFMLEPTQDKRFYKCIRLTSWHGEMILSIFYRFVLIANTLYVETDYRLLPPWKTLYYEIDTIEPSFSIHKTWHIMKASFASTAELWLSSPVKVFNYLFANWLHDRERQRIERSIKDNPTFDYGSHTSLREAASDDKYHHSFQSLDKEMYVKIIERQLLESIVEFLDAKNIDTSNFEKRQDAILNNAVIAPDGSFPASTQAKTRPSVHR